MAKFTIAAVEIEDGDKKSDLYVDQEILLIGGKMIIDELRLPNFARSGSDWYTVTIADDDELIFDDVPHDRVPQP
jgi:hypothetical protein